MRSRALEYHADGLHSSIREDVEALAQLRRRTTTAGERESAEWVARRSAERALGEGFDGRVIWLKAGEPTPLEV